MLAGQERKWGEEVGQFGSIFITWVDEYLSGRRPALLKRYNFQHICGKYSVVSTACVRDAALHMHSNKTWLAACTC